MDRNTLILYSVVGSLGTALMVFPVFFGIEDYGAGFAIGILLVMASGLIANSSKAYDPVTVHRRAAKRLFIALVLMGVVIGAVCWMQQTVWAKAHDAAIKLALMGLFACLWSARVGFEWGRLLSEKRNENSVGEKNGAA